MVEQHRFGAAHLFGGQRREAAHEHRVPGGGAVAVEARLCGDANAVESDARRRPRRVDADLGFDRDALRGNLDGEERDASRRLAERRDHESRIGSADHVRLLSAQQEAAVDGFRRRADAVGFEDATGFAERDRRHQVAGRDRRQQALALRVAAAFGDRDAGEQRAEERAGHQAPPHLLHHDLDVQPAEARAAVGFGQHQSHPAELREFLPERAVEADARVGELAQLRHRQPLREEAARFGAQQRVLLGAAEIGRDFEFERVRCGHGSPLTSSSGGRARAPR